MNRLIACITSAALAVMLHPATLALADDDALARALYRTQFEIEDVGTTSNDARYATATAVTAYGTITCPNASDVNIDGEQAVFAYQAYKHPVTGAELRAVKLEKATLNGVQATLWGCPLTGLRPGTHYMVDFYTVYTVDGRTVASSPESISMTTAAMTCPQVSPVKLSASKARITLKVPEAMRVKGAFKMKVCAGKKAIKTLATTTAATRAFTYSKKGAGKASYKVVCEWTGGTGVSKTGTAVKARANKVSYKRSSKVADYAYALQDVYPLKISYTSKGKLKAKVLWVNTKLAKAESGFKAKVTVKCQGKKIATQTFDSKKMKRMTTKKGTLVFKKAKKLKDLVNGNVQWSVKIVKSY